MIGTQAVKFSAITMIEGAGRGIAGALMTREEPRTHAVGEVVERSAV